MKAALAASLAISLNAQADDYPSRPVNVIVPYSAGGSSDAVARLVGQKMGEVLKQPFIVENRAGAGATIGTAFAGRRGQEGYTLLLADNAQAVAPAMFSHLSYDAVGDFSMVGFVGDSRVMLFASKSSGIASLRDLLQKAKAQPGKLAIGTGQGSPSHLMTELFQARAGIKLQVVPYKGASAALADLMAGHIDLVLSNPASGASYSASGKISVLAQSGAKRDARYADVPTFAESGIANFEASYWFALLAPSDTPAPSLQKLKGALQATLQDASVRHKLDELGIDELDPRNAGGMEKIQAESALWKSVVATSGIVTN
ncbi:Bug family tripartite tricarboxylate transporter substrate binding protein [Achromobacter aloeverae]|nr:tripartite tricarboxylate transporter substrate-binding protein [Achromobacter aloeverae]